MPNKKPKKLIAFGWYGGKYSHLNWLLPLLPECYHYCEPFAGSASVLLNRSPSPLETYNDLDGEVVHFFRTLRTKPQALQQALALTPFARQEYGQALATDDPVDEVERARRFYIKARQTRTGLAQKASIGRWAYCTTTSRQGMAGAVSRWLNGQAHLEAIATRLLRVQLEHGPAVEVIQRYDSEGTLFYCDPPYLSATRTDPRAYAHEMTDQDYALLASCLNACQGRVALSGYDHPLMAEWFPPDRWHKHKAPRQAVHASKSLVRQEVLWTNYKVEPTQSTGTKKGKPTPKGTQPHLFD